MLATNISMGYKPEPRGGRAVWFFRTVIMAAILLRQPSTFAQTPWISISVTNGTASISWPQTAFYYLLQSSTNLSGSNSLFNLATASFYSGSMAPIIPNAVGNNFVITQSTANARQFFRLRPPVAIPVDSFAIFYTGPLEFTSRSTMVVNGLTHANNVIDVGTSASLTFNGKVTSAMTICYSILNGQTITSGEGTTFNNGFITNTPAFRSTVGTNNLHVLIDIPPPGEDHELIARPDPVV